MRFKCLMSAIRIVSYNHLSLPVWKRELSWEATRIEYMAVVTTFAIVSA